MNFLKVLILLIPVVTYAEAIRATKSDNVVERFGVNTHFQYYSYGHAPGSAVFESLFSRLRELGIRHIRDRTGNDPNIDTDSLLRYSIKLKRLSDSGIKSSLIAMSPEFNIGYQDGLYESEKIRLHIEGGTVRGRVFPGGVKIHKILGLNEYDNIFSGTITCPHDTRVIPLGLNWLGRVEFCRGTNWARDLISFSNGLYDGIKTHPNPIIRAIQITGPPLVNVPFYNSTTMDSLRGLNQYIENQSANLYDFRSVASVRIFDREFPTRNNLFQDNKIDVTEFGYYSTPRNEFDNNWLNESRIGWNTLVSLFDFLEHPLVGDIFYYELLSQEGFSTAPDPMQGSFGLLDPSYNPRPAFYALKNLFQIFSDLNSNFDPGIVDFTITANTLPATPTGVKSSLYQKSSGEFLLVLRFIRQDRNNDLENFFKQVNISFAEQWNIDLIRPSVSPFSFSRYDEVTELLNLPVPDDVLILKLTKNYRPPPTPTPEPTIGRSSCDNYKVSFKRKKRRIVIIGANSAQIINKKGDTLRDLSTISTFKAKIKIPKKIGRYTLKTNCGIHTFRVRRIS